MSESIKTVRAGTQLYKIPMKKKYTKKFLVEAEKEFCPITTLIEALGYKVITVPSFSSKKKRTRKVKRNAKA